MRDEKIPERVASVCGGRLQRGGKSKRSEVPPDGHRSDSSGIFDKFPTQRSSGSVRVALRLTRPPGLRDAKIFSPLCRCPPHTDATRSGIFSSCGMEGKACKKDVVYGIIAEAGCLRTVWQSVCP